MRVKYSPLFLAKVKKVDVRIYKSLRKNLAIFIKDSNAPQLGNHELHEEWEGFRSIDITANWRASSLYKGAEVREKVFKTLVSLPFKAEFIVARKNEAVFIKRHQKRPNLFYDDLISKLFENQLHQSDQSIIYFAVRGNRARQLPLEDAIRKSVLAFESKWGIKIETQKKEPPRYNKNKPLMTSSFRKHGMTPSIIIKGLNNSDGRTLHATIYILP